MTSRENIIIQFNITIDPEFSETSLTSWLFMYWAIHFSCVQISLDGFLSSDNKIWLTDTSFMYISQIFIMNIYYFK